MESAVLIAVFVCRGLTANLSSPKAIAQRIKRYADLVGLENVIAGVNCRFGTFAGRNGVHPEVDWAKLGAMV